MIVIADNRTLVADAYAKAFDELGLPLMAMKADDFLDWGREATPAVAQDLTAVLVSDGDFAGRTRMLELVRGPLAGVPVIVLAERPNLETTLHFFAAGVDDVVRKPVHARELLARARRIRANGAAERAEASDTRLRVFGDGRDPHVDGAPLELPRRERRVLEHLASIGGRRATKEQLYAAIYGPFCDDVEETVVESHVSKLRKKLRRALGYDPIDSKRYLGYRLSLEEAAGTMAMAA